MKPDEEKKKELAENISTYVVDQHPRFKDMEPNYRGVCREAIKEAVGVLTGDIGAAQNFVSAIGLDVDLYKDTYGSFTEEELKRLIKPEPYDDWHERTCATGDAPPGPFPCDCKRSEGWRIFLLPPAPEEG